MEYDPNFTDKELDKYFDHKVRMARLVYGEKLFMNADLNEQFQHEKEPEQSQCGWDRDENGRCCRDA